MPAHIGIRYQIDYPSEPDYQLNKITTLWVNATKINTGLPTIIIKTVALDSCQYNYTVSITFTLSSY